MKIRVCHMSSVHGQEDVRIFHKECISLANFGYEVYLITRGNSYVKSGVKIVGVSNKKVPRIKRMLCITDEIYKKALKINADIYHAHDPELLPVCRKLKRKGKIVIFDSHEHVVSSINEKQYLPRAIRNIIKYIYSLYQRAVCVKLDAIITATPNVTEYFWGIGCKKVVDLCNFPILRKNKEPDYTSRTVVFAGSINKQWNHDTIIKAIEKIEDIKYILCGSSSEVYLDSIRSLEGWNKVEFRGRVPFEEVEDVLASSAIGLSLLSPGGNTDGINGNMANTKIFEEMMAGFPVICTGFKRWKVFVDKYECGICVNPNNMEEVRKAIQALIDSPKEMSRLGNNGRKAIEKEFNWGMEEKKLLSLYKELLKE